MPTNTYNSKVIFNGDVLMDLTGDTVTAASLLKGITAHGKDGAPITGTCDWDAATGDATASAAEILTGKAAYVKGKKVTGTMPNRSAVAGKISTKAGAYTVPQGYHDGSGKVTIDSTEQAKLIPTNIRNGVTVLGVEGTMSGSEDMKSQSKSVIPKASAQTVLPDEDYNCLSQVEVAAIPYAVSDNTSGGKTVTIG